MPSPARLTSDRSRHAIPGEVDRVTRAGQRHGDQDYEEKPDDDFALSDDGIIQHPFCEGMDADTIAPSMP